MNRLLHYIECWILRRQKVFLLWCGSNVGQDEDYFVHVEVNGIDRLLITRNIQELVNYADANDLKLDSRSKVDLELDFDRLRNILSKLKPGKEISTKEAEVLLNSWNMFNDISYSLDRSILQINVRSRKYSKKEIFHIYDKIFWGNNLPPVTPQGEEYHPIFLKKEVYFLKHAFAFALKEIANEIAFSVARVQGEINWFELMRHDPD
jgi:hypothetical protein